MGGRGSSGGKKSGDTGSQKSSFDVQEVQRGLSNMKQYAWGADEYENLLPMLAEEMDELDTMWKESYLTNSRKYEGESYISLNSLYTIQENVSKSDIANIALTDKGEIKDIAVLKHNGRYIVMDGNHRANAAILRGYKKIKAKVYSVK